MTVWHFDECIIYNYTIQLKQLLIRYNLLLTLTNLAYTIGRRSVGEGDHGVGL